MPPLRQGVETERGANLQVVAGLLAVGDPLDLHGRVHVEGLAQVGEAEGPGNPHVRQGQVVYIQQGPETGQTGVEGERRRAERGEGGGE